MGTETSESTHEEPKPKTGEDEGAKNKAPEQRESEDKIVIRRITRELQQKGKDALELGKSQEMTPEAKMQLVSDFIKNQLASLSANERQIISKNPPVLIFPDRELDKIATQKWGKDTYLTAVYQVAVDSSLAANVSLINKPNINNSELYYDSAKASDAGKAPNEGAATIDRPPEKLMGLLSQKALDAKTQFTNAGGKKSEFTYMQAINDYISDAYSRFTSSEKASLNGQQISSEVKINRSDASSVTGMITANFTAKIRLFSNNYIVHS